MGRAVEILVRGLVVSHGHILLCRSAKRSNTYLPGGHLEFGERAREGLTREIEEELDVASEAKDFLGVIEHSFIQDDKPHCEINLVFRLDIASLEAPEPVIPAEKHLSFSWARLDALARHKLEPSVLCNRIPEWLNTPTSKAAWASAGRFA